MITENKPIALVKDYFEETGMKKLTCSICGCDFYDWTGRNTYPVVQTEGAVCCHDCDHRFVIPARERMHQNQ